MISRTTISDERPRRPNRRGATLVEAAISLGVLLTFIVFLLDYSIASFRSQSLNYLADRLARVASVQGPKTPSSFNGGTWGPTAVTTTLAASDRVALVARLHNMGLPPDQVTIRVTWPSGSNASGEPVTVTTEMPWTPSMMRPFTQGVMTLRGVSRQIMAH